LLSKNVEIKIYRAIILPVVVCECEACSLTLREDHRLRVFENRVLREIFGLKGGSNKKLNKNEIKPRNKQKILQQKNIAKEESRGEFWASVATLLRSERRMGEYRGH
jgi:hypothetical protein